DESSPHPAAPAATNTNPSPISKRSPFIAPPRGSDYTGRGLEAYPRDLRHPLARHEFAERLAGGPLLRVVAGDRRDHLGRVLLRDPAVEAVPDPRGGAAAAADAQGVVRALHAVGALGHQARHPDIGHVVLAARVRAARDLDVE